MSVKHGIRVHYFRHITKLWRATIRFVMSVCLSILLFGASWLPLDRFL